MTTQSRSHLLIIKESLNDFRKKLELNLKSAPVVELIQINIILDNVDVLLDAINNELKTKHSNGKLLYWVLYRNDR